MRILLTGGGTGGHIYPALAVARGFQNKYPDSELLYVGTKKGLEADLVPKAGIPFRIITVEGLERKISLRNFRAFVKAAIGSFQAWVILNTFRPEIVVGTGGYVSGPVVLAAACRRVPIVLHEQNAVPGLTNRKLGRFASTICLTFPVFKQHFPIGTRLVHTGLPVRTEVLKATRAEGIRELKLDPKRLTIVITGGSSGARSINLAAVDLALYVLKSPDLQLLHITGRSEYDRTLEEIKKKGIDLSAAGNITVVPYLYQMEHALAAADLIVGRAGATFIAEITVRGIPAVLVPYPYAAENHQEQNARVLAERGAAVIVHDRELSGRKLCSVVKGLLEDAPKRERMAVASSSLGLPRALENIIQVIEEQLGRGGCSQTKRQHAGD